MGVNIAVEGRVDEAVALRLLEVAGLEALDIFRRRGKTDLDPSIPGYVAAAGYWPWLIMRDLDQDADCAPDLLEQLVPVPTQLLCFRIPVRQVESWLLADRSRIASVLSVGVAHVPTNPDGLVDAKAEMLRLAGRSRSQRVRREMLPREGSGGRIGPLYSDTLAQFARLDWNVSAAAERSDSLARALAAVQAITFPA